MNRRVVFVVLFAFANSLHAATVSLCVSQMPYVSKEKIYPQCLHRELVRQAFLIQARDEHGCLTRDEIVGEHHPNGRFEFDLRIVYRDEISADFKLFYKDKLLQEAKAEIPKIPDRLESTGLRLATVLINETSRHFQEGLSNNGFPLKSRDAKTNPRTNLTEIDEALSRMNVLAQYRAVRQLHDCIAQNGYSEQTLGRLSRAYANLSQLSQFYLMDTRIAFAARAILYSTKMKKLYPESVNSDWHQAYVFTVIGLTGDSIRILERAPKDSEEREPQWLKLIRLANDYAYLKLKKRKDIPKELAELASFLTFRSIEFCGSKPLIIEEAKRALNQNPLSLRVLHGMDRVSGVSYRHRTTTMNNAVFVRQMAGELPKLQDPAVKQTLKKMASENYSDPQERIRLFRALQSDADEDQLEPSIGILAHLLQEIELLHLAQRYHFLRYYLGVDGHAEIQKMEAAFTDHPTQPFYDFFAIPRHDMEEQEQAVKRIPKLGLSMVGGYRLLAKRLDRRWQIKDCSTDDYRVFQWVRSPSLEADYSVKINIFNAENSLIYAEAMEPHNPKAPKRAVTLVRHDWQNESKRAEEWLKNSYRHPAVLHAVADRYYFDGKVKEAEELWQEYVDIAADFDAYHKLAASQFLRGNIDDSLQTAKAFLREEDYGLSHSRMAQSVAHSLMSDGDFTEALPWAETCAQSGAAWAFLTHAHCLTRTGNLREAAEIYDAVDQRYQGETLYHFWVRHRAGDAEKAWKNRLAYMRLHKTNQHNLLVMGALQRLYQNRAADGIKLLDKTTNEKADSLTLGYGAVLRSNANQTKERDEILKRIKESTFGKEDPFANIIQLVASSVLAGKIDDKIKELQFESIDLKICSHFWKGWCYEMLGDVEKAIAEYEECTKSQHLFNTVLLACHQLQNLGETPAPLPFSYKGFKQVMDEVKSKL